MGIAQKGREKGRDCSTARESHMGCTISDSLRSLGELHSPFHGEVVTDGWVVVIFHSRKGRFSMTVHQVQRFPSHGQLVE